MVTLKTPAEILKMRRAGFLVWKAHQLVQSLIRPGITTRELDAAVEKFFESRGAEGLFKGVPGRVPYPAVTCISVNEEVVHGIPGPRVIQDGDIVSVDTGCRLEGWCGDAAATYPVGAVDAEKLRLLRVTKAALDLAIELLPKRKYWSEVAAAMQQFVQKEGFTVVEAFVGHGIGRKMHEEPQVPNFVNAQFVQNGDFRLQPGMVLAIEPMVNMGTRNVRLKRDFWTQVTADGRASAHFEHTVALTDRGAYVLTGPVCDLDAEMGFAPC